MPRTVRLSEIDLRFQCDVDQRVFGKLPAVVVRQRAHAAAPRRSGCSAAAMPVWEAVGLSGRDVDRPTKGLTGRIYRRCGHGAAARLLLASLPSPSWPALTSAAGVGRGARQYYHGGNGTGRSFEKWKMNPVLAPCRPRLKFLSPTGTEGPRHASDPF